MPRCQAYKWDKIKKPHYRVAFFSMSRYPRHQFCLALTWIKQVEDQLKQINVNIEEAFELAKDKIEWRKTVNLWSQNVARATITV